MEYIFIALALAIIVVFLFARKKVKVTASNIYIPVREYLYGEEKELWELIELYRGGFARLSILMPDERCKMLADTHTKWMATKGVTSHDLAFDRKDFILKSGFSHYGEIVGSGYNSPKSILAAYLNSESHAKIIESDKFQFIGVSIYKREGKMYNTIIFAG